MPISKRNFEKNGSQLTIPAPSRLNAIRSAEHQLLIFASLAFLLLITGWLAFLLLTAQISSAQEVKPSAFVSSEQASHSLYTAVKNNDETSLIRILGGDKELLSAGDDLQDKYDRQLFAHKYYQMHRLVEEPDGTTVLYIGAENWPFPVPIVSSNGGWHFDSELGKEEVLCRRIGENETTAIQTGHALILAEKEGPTVRDVDPISQYVSDFVRGDKDKRSTDTTLAPFRGYYFRVLTSQDKDAVRGVSDGLAVIAYPADYQSTGVLTFIVDQNNVVLEKDLGRNTAKIVKAMTAYDRSSIWHAAE